MQKVTVFVLLMLISIHIIVIFSNLSLSVIMCRNFLDLIVRRPGETGNDSDFSYESDDGMNCWKFVISKDAGPS